MSGTQLAAWGTSPADTSGDWRDEAACREVDPELFFPIGNTGAAIPQIEDAKAVCRRCEVREVCLRWALDTGQDAGVWGGLSEDERRSRKRRNARASRADDDQRTIRPRVLVPAAGVRLLLQDAAGREWTVRQIARATMVDIRTVTEVLDGRLARVTETTAAKVASADLSGPPPSAAAPGPPQVSG